MGRVPGPHLPPSDPRGKQGAPSSPEATGSGGLGRGVCGGHRSLVPGWVPHLAGSCSRKRLAQKLLVQRPGAGRSGFLGGLVPVPELRRCPDSWYLRD